MTVGSAHSPVRGSGQPPEGMMRAVVLRRHGGRSRLAAEFVPVPTLEVGEVLVEVLASPVALADFCTLPGLRVDDLGCEGKNADEWSFGGVVGRDACGVVVAHGGGDDVASFSLLGTTVVLRTNNVVGGTWAQYVAVRSSECKPVDDVKRIGPEILATVFEPTMTALHFADIVRSGAHKAVLVTAPCSTIMDGLMSLVNEQQKSSAVHGTKFICVVESRAESEDVLSRHCGSAVAIEKFKGDAVSFRNAVKKMIRDWRPTMMFDACGGDDLEACAALLPRGSHVITYGAVDKLVPVGSLITSRHDLITTAFWFPDWWDNKRHHDRLLLMREAKSTLKRRWRPRIEAQCGLTRMTDAILMCAQRRSGPGSFLLSKDVDTFTVPVAGSAAGKGAAGRPSPSPGRPGRKHSMPNTATPRRPYPRPWITRTSERSEVRGGEGGFRSLSPDAAASTRSQSVNAVIAQVRSLAHESEDDSVMLRIAEKHWADGNTAKARLAFETAISVRPDNPLALCNYALLLVELGDDDEAYEYSSRSVELAEGNYSEAKSGTGVVSGSPLAVDSSRKTLGTTLYILGKIAAHVRGDPAEAGRCLRRAVRLGSELAPAALEDLIEEYGDAVGCDDGESSSGDEDCGSRAGEGDAELSDEDVAAAGGPETSADVSLLGIMKEMDGLRVDAEGDSKTLAVTDLSPADEGAPDRNIPATPRSASPPHASAHPEASSRLMQPSPAPSPQLGAQQVHDLLEAMYRDDRKENVTAGDVDHCIRLCEQARDAGQQGRESECRELCDKTLDLAQTIFSSSSLPEQVRSETLANCLFVCGICFLDFLSDGATAEGCLRRALEMGCFASAAALGDLLLFLHGDVPKSLEKYRTAAEHCPPNLAFCLHLYWVSSIVKDAEEAVDNEGGPEPASYYGEFKSLAQDVKTTLQTQPRQDGPYSELLSFDASASRRRYESLQKMKPHMPHSTPVAAGKPRNVLSPERVSPPAIQNVAAGSSTPPQMTVPVRNTEKGADSDSDGGDVEYRDVDHGGDGGGDIGGIYGSDDGSDGVSSTGSITAPAAPHDGALSYLVEQSREIVFGRGDYREAGRKLHRAMQLSMAGDLHFVKEIRYLQGLVFMRTKQMAAALRVLEANVSGEAVEDGQGAHPESLYLLSELSHRMKRPEAAEKYYNQLHDMGPETLFRVLDQATSYFSKVVNHVGHEDSSD